VDKNPLAAAADLKTTLSTFTRHLGIFNRDSETNSIEGEYPMMVQATSGATMCVFLLIASAEVRCAHAQQPKNSPAPLYVMMVSHFDQPFVMTREDLDSLEKLAVSHPRVRWTHFFNPVIYTQTTVLRDDIVEFICKAHTQSGAEIALHLHMYKSLLNAAGVAFQAEPSVNSRMVVGSRDATGYSVPMSRYSPAEIHTLLQFSIGTFEKVKLQRPTTFCAGYYTTSLDLQKEIAASGFTASAAAFPPGKEIGDAYPPSWRELAGWDESVTINSRPYRVSQNSILPTGEAPYILANDGQPLVEIPQTGKIDWMVTSDDMRVIFKKHLSMAESGQPTAVCLAIHDMYAKKNFAKFDEVLGFIDEIAENGVPVRYATVSEVRAAFIRHWKD
jgi:hypothetical protein